jgi:hypothetical protein
VKKPAILFLAIGLASCAAPKAIVVEEVSPVRKKQAPAAAPKPTPPTLPANDGMRLPEDLLALPDDSQLRSAATPNEGDAIIIARPPEE